MKKSSLTLIITMLFTALISLNFIEPAPAPATFKVDPAESKMKWIGKKVTGEHTGFINIQSGELVVEKNKLTGGKFTIDVTSLTVADLTDPKSNGNLVRHLKSDDFFSAEKFPTSNFEITEIKPIKDAAKDAPNYDVKGKLTIKGITNEISFPATVTVEKSKITAVAAFKVDRSKYDIKFRSKSFFENLGDKMIYDDFDIEVNLVAKK
jgi:polyisoprenoid-binding protein YceI